MEQKDSRTEGTVVTEDVFSAITERAEHWGAVSVGRLRTFYNPWPPCPPCEFFFAFLLTYRLWASAQRHLTQIQKLKIRPRPRETSSLTQ